VRRRVRASVLAHPLRGGSGVRGRPGRTVPEEHGAQHTDLLLGRTRAFLKARLAAVSSTRRQAAVELCLLLESTERRPLCALDGIGLRLDHALLRVAVADAAAELDDLAVLHPDGPMAVGTAER